MLELNVKMKNKRDVPFMSKEAKNVDTFFIVKKALVISYLLLTSVRIMENCCLKTKMVFIYELNSFNIIYLISNMSKQKKYCKSHGQQYF